MCPSGLVTHEAPGLLTDGGLLGSSLTTDRKGLCLHTPTERALRAWPEDLRLLPLLMGWTLCPKSHRPGGAGEQRPRGRGRVTLSCSGPPTLGCKWSHHSTTLGEGAGGSEAPGESDVCSGQQARVRHPGVWKTRSTHDGAPGFVPLHLVLSTLSCHALHPQKPNLERRERKEGT